MIRLCKASKVEDFSVMQTDTAKRSRFAACRVPRSGGGRLHGRGRVPVTVQDVDITAHVWHGIIVIALVSSVWLVLLCAAEAADRVLRELRHYSRLPLTAVPALSSLTRRVLTRSGSKAFQLPKSSGSHLMAGKDPLGGPARGATTAGAEVRRGLAVVLSSADDEARVVTADGDAQ